MSEREKDILFNSRPHPGPLPRGEGGLFAGFRPYWSRRWLEARSTTQGRPSVIPSPGGEGQGEGSRHTIIEPPYVGCYASE